jgi:transposase
MLVRYDLDTRAKAIRLAREHASDYPSEYAAITAVARRLGMSPETLRKRSRTSRKAGPSAYGTTVGAGSLFALTAIFTVLNCYQCRLGVRKTSVELRGLEPLAFWMQTRRSSS